LQLITFALIAALTRSTKLQLH